MAHLITTLPTTIDPKTGQIHPRIKPQLLDLTRHHFTDARTA
ncbi:MAG: hypothetical protein R3F65_09190 [bacterium]